MTIVVSAGVLAKALSRVKPGKTPAALTANCYVLITHNQPNQASLTMLEAGNYYSTVYIQTLSGGVESEYLIHPEELENVLRKVDHNTELKLSPNPKGVRIETRIGRRVVSTYSDLSHFGPVERAKKLIATVPAENWNATISALARFGGFRDSDPPELAFVTMEIADELKLMSPTPHIASQTFLFQTVNLEQSYIDTSIKYNIRGRYIKKLQDISKDIPVSIYYNTLQNYGLLTVEGDQSTVTLYTLPLDKSSERFLQLFGTKTELVSLIDVDKEFLLAAVRLQQPADNAKHPYLQLTQVGDDLRLQVYGNESDYSDIPLLHQTSDTEPALPWQPICLNSKALLRSLEVSSEQPIVTLEVRKFKRNNSQNSYAFYALLTLDAAQQTLLSLLFPNDLEGL